MVELLENTNLEDIKTYAEIKNLMRQNDESNELSKEIIEFSNKLPDNAKTPSGGGFQPMCGLVDLENNYPEIKQVTVNLDMDLPHFPKEYHPISPV